MANSKKKPSKTPKGEKTKVTKHPKKTKKQTKKGTSKTKVKASKSAKSKPEKVTFKKEKRPYSKGLLISILVLIGILLLGFLYLFSPQPTLNSPTQNSIATSGEMILEFSQAMNKKSVEENINISPELKGQWQWKSRKTLHFQPTQPLAVGQQYRLSLNHEAKNGYGKRLVHRYQLNFTVTGVPEVLLVSPYETGMFDREPKEEEVVVEEAGEEETPLPVIDLHQPIVVFFDQPMDWKTIPSKELLITKPAVEGEIRFLAERAFEFTPKQWPAKTALQLTVPKGLIAQNGLKTQQALSWQLQTPGQKIVQIHPSLDEAIAPTQALEVTFQLPVNREEVTLGENIQLFPSNAIVAEGEEPAEGMFSGTVSAKPDDALTLLLTPTPAFAPETDYELVFQPNLAGLEEEFKVSFRTGLANQESIENTNEEGGQESENQLLSLPSGFAPRVDLNSELTFPITVQKCKLSPEVNPFALPQSDAPCAPEEASIETNTTLLELGPLYPEETWSNNALHWVKVSDAQGFTQIHHLLLTDTILVVKRAGDDLLVWALDRFNQEPVPQLEVRVYTPDGNELGRGVTDGRGIYKRNQQWSEQVYVVGLKQLSGENRWSVATDQWPLEVGSADSLVQTSPEVYLLTDRNQMQAGETLNFKGLWRVPTQRGYSLPYWGEITLKLLNEKGEEMASQIVEMGNKASFNGQMTLPESLATGLYQIKAFEFERPLSTLNTWIKVQDPGTGLSLAWLQPPDFSNRSPQAKVRLSDGNGLVGATANGQWQLYEHNAFNPLHTRTLLQGEFRFDPKGEGQFTLEWEGESPLKPNTDYSLNVQVKDQLLPVNLTHSFNYQPIDYPVQLVLEEALLEENSPLRGSLLSPEEGSIPAVTLELFAPGERKPLWEREETLDEAKQAFEYNDLILPNLESGVYELQARAGKEVVSQKKAIYIAKDKTQAIDEQLSVFLSHESRNVNKRSKLLLNVPEATPDAPITVLLSYEQAGLLGYDVVVAENPLNVIEFDVQPSMSPGVYVSALTIGYEEEERLVELKQELRTLYAEREALENPEVAEEEKDEGEFEVLAPKDPTELQAQEVEEQKRIALIQTLTKSIEVLEKQRKDIRAHTLVKVNATQAYLPVDERRKALTIKLALTPNKGEENGYEAQVQVLDEALNPTPATVSLFVRPKLHFFLSPMDYFLSLPPFNVSTHSNLLLDSSSQAQSSSLSQNFKNLIHPFLKLPYLVFEPLLYTNEGLDVSALTEEELANTELGKLSYSFQLPAKTERDWEVVAFANTQDNQWGTARFTLPMSQTFSLSAHLPALLTVGDVTELEVKVQNHSNKILEGPLVVKASALTFGKEPEQTVSLKSGESQTLHWPITVTEDENRELTVEFQGESKVQPLTLHPGSSTPDEQSNVFAWLRFSDPETQQEVTDFERGKTYTAQLTLMNRQGVQGTAKLNEETGEELQIPFPVQVNLPAGLKFSQWLEPYGPSLWEERQNLANKKGLSWVQNPLWFFQNIGARANQINLTSQNLPAGVYQLNFEVQALWPGRFKLPAMRWGESWVSLEEGGWIVVK